MDVRKDVYVLKHIAIEMAMGFNSLSQRIIGLYNRIQTFSDEECIGMELATAELYDALASFKILSYLQAVEQLETVVQTRLAKREELGFAREAALPDPASNLIALHYYKDLMGANEAAQVLAQGYCDLDVLEEIEVRFYKGKDLSSDDHAFLESLFKKYNIERR